jgi:hypothetical protein
VDVSSQEGSHGVWSFGCDVLAEFEDGEQIGVVYATMVRPFRYLDEVGTVENGEFLGLLEFSPRLGQGAIAQLAHGNLVRLRSDPNDPDRRLPVASFLG